MRKVKFCLLIVSIFLFSCEYRQFCYLSTGDQIKASDSLYYFENDTVKITYSFWAEKGILSYEIYNKLPTPLYIDWKKSSFVINNIKKNYWADETKTSRTSVNSNLFNFRRSSATSVGITTTNF